MSLLIYCRIWMRTSVQTNQMNTNFKCMSAHGITQRWNFFFSFLPMFTRFSFIWLITQSLFFLISKMKTGKNYVQGFEKRGSQKNEPTFEGFPPPTTRLRWPWIMLAVAVRSQRKRERVPLRSGRPLQNWRVKCGCSLQRREGRHTICKYLNLNQCSFFELELNLNAL